MKAQFIFRPLTFALAEQPKGSFMFKMKIWTDLATQHKMKKDLTYEGLFGADLEKGTHMLHNLPSGHRFARRMTKDVREKFRKRMATAFIWLFTVVASVRFFKCWGPLPNMLFSFAIISSGK
jgi:hypothetical protein